ncbi:response regulator [Asticcacaulis biprosthecium C19]|uniref:Response regulator n=1 Tax=Asticcacaulis biprosthecium C19 TaxID=715226 RepID=F4QU81_9CAUL|nr:response regulator transcription factor [Asticcacaulis biprosthecium]EGF89381.1 response regulator [Asticcacaulis biprosthecium C19]
MTRDGLCLVIEDQPDNQARMKQALTAAFDGLEIVCVANLKAGRLWLSSLDGERARRFVLAIVDLGLPDGSGIELIQEITAGFPAATCVVSSMYDDDGHLFEALSAGARGYLVKHQEPDMIVHYLRRIEQGEPPLSPSIALRLLDHFRTQAPKADPDVALTGRETETLALLARGLTIAEVARHLGLAHSTVAGYVKLIYQKLNISTRVEATLHAVKRGLA